MTSTTSTASKLFVAFVATAMLFTLSYTPAKAATAAELQAQIDALLAQISGMTSGGGSSSCAQFTMDLTMGASGAEVTALQNFLIGKGHAIAAGATGYFGGQTQAALSAYQSANGISPAAGYFGPITRAKVNASCTTSGGDDDSSDDDSSDDDSDDSSDEELSGEASLDDVTYNDGDDTDLEEGQEDAPVAEFEVEFADGDAKITRLDVAFVATGVEEDPWDTFDEVSLWVDGDEVARMDASDEDEYLDENDGSLRFSGLDIVGMEDEAVTIVVGVTVQGSVDNVPATWTVDMDAMRYIDADDVSTTDTTTGDMGATGIDFEIDVEGNEDEVIVKSSTEDPDATTIAVENTTKSDWVTVFAFDLDTDDSTNDIEVNEIPVSFTSSATTTNVISDVQLVIGGETYDDRSAFSSGSGTTTASTTFDIDGDLVIDAGERVTVEVQVELKALTGNYAEGTTLFATTTGSLGDFEGADDVVGEGAATGETHTLRTEGAILELNDTTEVIKANTTDTVADDEGVFTIKVDVTAFESDLYFNKTLFNGTTGIVTTAGVNFLVEDSTGAAVASTTGTTTASVSSTADTEGTQFKVSEGETETFTITVNFNPTTQGFYQVQLYSMNFATAAAANPSTQQLALPASDFETDQLSI